MPTAHHDGTDVFYRVDGAGPALVLVHGTGGNGEINFGHLVPRLAERFTVLRPDYSGSGETVDPGGALTVGRLADEVMAAADAAGLERFDLVGFSLGAPVAVDLAARHPDRVRRLVLTAGFARADDARMQLQFRLWRHLAEHDPELQTRLQWLTGYSPGFVASLAPEAVEEAIATAVRIRRWPGFIRQVDLDLGLDVREAARAVRCPTLSIGCRLDHIVPPAHARELADLIPGARHAEIESGHVAPIEQPDVFVAMVEAFLDG